MARDTREACFCLFEVNAERFFKASLILINNFKSFNQWYCAHTPKKKQNIGKNPKGDVEMDRGRQPNKIRDSLPEKQSNFSLFGQNPRQQVQAAPQK